MQSKNDDDVEPLKKREDFAVRLRADRRRETITKKRLLLYGSKEKSKNMPVDRDP